MTLGEAKKIVRFLLDSELYDEYEEKLNNYFDIGQKRIVTTTDFIGKIHKITVREITDLNLEQMDSKFYKLRKIHGGRWEKISQTSVRLYEGTYEIFYNVFPTTITEHTGDAYQFEISEIAQTALPYYVAAQVTIAEHDLRYHQVYEDEFANILENVNAVHEEGFAQVVPLGGINL